jgi:hypothetical protein
VPVGVGGISAAVSRRLNTEMRAEMTSTLQKALCSAVKNTGLLGTNVHGPEIVVSWPPMDNVLLVDIL